VNQLFLGGVNSKHGPYAQAVKAGLEPSPLKVVVATFRCWPIDFCFGHLNNASFVTVGELKRWRLFTELELFPLIIKRKALLVVVEQSVKYSKPILPLREYSVLTTIKITDDKWLHYSHSFEQHDDDVKDGTESIKYATIEAKCVLKDSNGKTIRPSEMAANSDLFKMMINNGNEEL
jgi:acyl-CoA thioesterase FadM